MHRVTLAAIVVSAKMYDDNYAANEFYAAVGMVDLWELNKMESVLLKKLDWKLLVPELAMVLIRSQLLSMDYDPETQEYSFKKREVGKKKQTCKVTKATKTIVIQNFHSRSNRKAITGPGQTRAEKPEEDTCAAW